MEPRLISEQTAYDEVKRILQAEGFRRILFEPKSKEFRFGSYLPDIVAERDGKNLAVEIKSTKNRAFDQSLGRLEKVVESKPNWTFRRFYVDELLKSKRLKGTDVSDFRAVLLEFDQALNAGYLKASLLLGWSLFEAAARKLHPRIFSQPQTPGRLITVLAERGAIDVEEAEILRRLASLRNNLIHGGLQVELEERSVRKLVDIARRIFEPGD